MTINQKAYAKINLALNITGVQDNLHTIDTIMTTIDLFDEVSVKKTNDNTKVIFFKNKNSKPYIIENNSVEKTVGLFKKDFNIKDNFEVTVIKNIPIAAGLGGSGVDAAATLIAICKLCNIDIVDKNSKNNENYSKLENIARQIGSDVVYQLKGGFARIEGVGEKITSFSCNKSFNLVVAQNTKTNGVLSKDSYRVLDEMYLEKEKLVCDIENTIKILTSGDITDYSMFTNALEKPSIFLNNSIVDTLMTLRENGAVHALMTGSGSACIGFFENKEIARQAAKNIKSQIGFAKYCRVL